MKKSLIIWVPGNALTGGFDTLKFEDVQDFSELVDAGIRFTYQGISTGEKREAYFPVTHLLGWAITDSSISAETKDYTGY